MYRSYKIDVPWSLKYTFIIYTYVILLIKANTDFDLMFINYYNNN